MAGWWVEYEHSDREDKTVFLSLPDDKYTTARAVQAAILKGEIAEVQAKAGGMVMVQKYIAGAATAAREERRRWWRRP